MNFKDKLNLKDVQNRQKEDHRLWCNAFEQKWHAMVSKGSKTGDFIKFLGAIRVENPLQTIILILDNARIHYAKVAKEECRKLNVRLVHLPPYSPNLNL